MIDQVENLMNAKLRVVRTILSGILVMMTILSYPCESLAYSEAQQSFIDSKQYNNLIADSAFIDIESMTVATIQSFLESYGSYLSTYSEGGRSAAQIIYDASHAHGLASGTSGDGVVVDSSTGTVSPRVILVYLDKEQSLIRKTSWTQDGLSWALLASMGMACYSGAPNDNNGNNCTDAYEGFTNQVEAGAWQLRVNYERSTGDYGFVNGSYYVGLTTQTVDGFNVTPANRATAAVYRYTPYVFNSGYNVWRYYKQFFETVLHVKTTPGSQMSVNTSTTTNWCYGNCDFQYANGVDLVIRTDDGGPVEFTGWTGCDSTSGLTCNLTMSDGKTVVASHMQSLTYGPDYNSPLGQWDYDSGHQLADGDFNGDGYQDVAVMYNYGSATTRLWVYPGNADGGYNGPVAWYISPAGQWDFTKSSNIVTSDINGDGLDDITVMYDYGSSTMGLWTFRSNGSQFNPSRAYFSPWGQWDYTKTSRLVASDTNNDSLDDITVMYDYGSSTMGLWTFRSNGSQLNPSKSYTSPAGQWDFTKSSNLTASDINNDGLDDITVMYNYGSSTIALWTFKSGGSSFSPSRAYISQLGHWNFANGHDIVAGDINGDGYQDIAVMYDYLDATTNLWVFPGNASNNYSNPQAWYLSPVGQWNYSNTSNLITSDKDSDGADEVSVMYNYYSSTIKFLRFMPTGMAYSRD